MVYPLLITPCSSSFNHWYPGSPSRSMAGAPLVSCAICSVVLVCATMKATRAATLSVGSRCVPSSPGHAAVNVAAVAQLYSPAAVGSGQRYGVGGLHTFALQLKRVHSPDAQSWYSPRQADAGSGVDDDATVKITPARGTQGHNAMAVSRLIF